MCQFVIYCKMYSHQIHSKFTIIMTVRLIQPQLSCRFVGVFFGRGVELNSTSSHYLWCLCGCFYKRCSLYMLPLLLETMNKHSFQYINVYLLKCINPNGFIHFVQVQASLFSSMFCLFIPNIENLSCVVYFILANKQHVQ